MAPLGEVSVDGVDCCLAMVEYNDVSRRFVSQLKYRGVRTAVPWFAEGMAALVGRCAELPDLVTWIPAARGNRSRRGFDQAEALARPLADRLGVRAVRLLGRSPGVGQTGQDRERRLIGPALRVTSSARCCGQRVLLVDDVLTTGASMRTAATACSAAGAAGVIGVVAAHRIFR